MKNNPAAAAAAAMENIKAKFVWNEEIRRIDVTQSLSETIASIKSAYPALGEFTITYKDQEGDLVTLTTEGEWRDELKDARKFNRLPKFYLVQQQQPKPNVPSSSPAVVEEEVKKQPSAPPQPPQPPQQPKEEEEAFEEPFFLRVARIFTKEENIAKLQAFAANALIWEGVQAVAKTYVADGEIAALDSAFAQMPMVLALVEELVSSIPELGSVLGKDFDLMSIIPMLVFGGRRRCGGNRANRCRASYQQVHCNVMCDGCESSPEFRERSQKNGNMTRHGRICGARYKSMKQHNYDLCQTCFDSKQFESNGPFECIGKKETTEAKKETTEAKKQQEEDPMEKWASVLQTLSALGFNFEEAYFQIFEEEQGDLTRIINRIVRRNA